MKLVQTLVVRDEADIIDAQLGYHLNAGVDFVIATDHDSIDGTTEILRSYERAGCLRLIREAGAVRESDWRTTMARAAATEYGADWVINTDADEFWVPRGGMLKEVLGSVPARFGVVWALTRHFVPRPDDGASFCERMTARVSPAAPINDPTSPYRPHAKAAHRGDPEITIGFGSHKVFSDRLAPLTGWYPADVFHFPFRTLEQYERKTVRRARGDKPLGQYVKGMRARDEGRVHEAYHSLVVDDASLRRGLAVGSLVHDTRLRDALLSRSAIRAIARTDADRDAVVEGDALREADLVRVLRHLDELRDRVGAIEQRGRRRIAR